MTSLHTDILVLETTMNIPNFKVAVAAGNFEKVLQDYIYVFPLHF